MSANPSPSAVTASVLTTPEVMNVRVIPGLNQALTCAIATTKTNVVLRDSVSTESVRTVEDHTAVHATKGSKIQQIQEFA